MPSSVAEGMAAVPIAELLPIAADYQSAGRDAEANRLLDHILAAAPNQPQALHGKGLTAYKSGDLLRAAALFEQAFEYGLDASLYWRTICTVYERLNRLDEAVAAGRRAVALDPADAEAYHNLTIACYRRLDLDETIACARQALDLDPSLAGAHFALAEALLLRGEFAEGWQEYEWRFRIPGAAPPVPAARWPQWDGRKLGAETLLLVADQGFGDVIQFARYISWAAERCPNIAIACSRELRPILAQVHPAAHLFSDWEATPHAAAFCPLSGLPRLHGTRLATIPCDIPYLRADTPRQDFWRRRLAGLMPRGYRAVGISWAGRRSHHNDINRSATLRDLAPLAACERTALVSLQKGDAMAEISAFNDRAPLLNLGPELDAFEDTAAVLACLDLVVSVDTSVAHLAGAMGMPVWIALPYAPDWRWLLDRADSPWYPSVRLFRQAVPRDWRHVFNVIGATMTAAGSLMEPPHP